MAIKIFKYFSPFFCIPFSFHLCHSIKKRHFNLIETYSIFTYTFWVYLRNFWHFSTPLNIVSIYFLSFPDSIQMCICFAAYQWVTITLLIVSITLLFSSHLDNFPWALFQFSDIFMLYFIWYWAWLFHRFFSCVFSSRIPFHLFFNYLCVYAHVVRCLWSLEEGYQMALRRNYRHIWAQWGHWEPNSLFWKKRKHF